MTSRRWLAAAGFGLVLLAAALVAAYAVVSTATAERDERDEAAAAIEAERVRTSVERTVVEMELLAAGGTDPVTFRHDAGQRVSAPDSALRSVALVLVDGDRLVVRTTVPGDLGPLTSRRDLAGDEALRAVLEPVVAEADAAAGVSATVEGRPLIAVAAPVVSTASTSEAARRSSVVGAVVALLDSSAVLGDWPGDARLVAPDGSGIGAARGDTFDGVVDIAGQPWHLLLDAENDGWPPAAWLVVVGGTIVAAGGAVAYQAQRNRRRRAEQQARERSQQLTRIAEAGTRLQQSLDLSTLLPAFAVALADDFDLDGVAVSLIDDEGSPLEVFATGDPMQDASLDLPLRRGFRAVGVLTVRPGRTLDETECVSLQALADLLAVAMSNAQLYEREQLNAARLRDLDALKNAFLGTVSHELRTSMTAIMGFGELLSDSWDSLDEERRREMANRIRRSAGSLRHLVDDLLDFARLEQERLRVSPRAVDLAGVVRQTAESLAPLLGSHELSLVLPDSVPAWADPVAIERILGNLLSNAAKYSPAGTTVTVSVEAVGDVARLVVRDQGPGIPPDERRRIFARFYRLDTPEAVRTRGAGIGLAILRDFADRSGATVTVDEAPGGGARFTVDFPSRPIDLEVGDRSMVVS